MYPAAINNENCFSALFFHFNLLFSLFFLFAEMDWNSFRLFSAASSDSIRFHSNLLSHDNDLRVSIDNTCTDSLVTALDDEALLINDYMNDMSKSKVSDAHSLCVWQLLWRNGIKWHTQKCSFCLFHWMYHLYWWNMCVLSLLISMSKILFLMFYYWFLHFVLSLYFR